MKNCSRDKVCRKISRRPSSRGFTLVELLVVVAIISILAALLLPALQGALGAARSTACVSNEKQMFLMETSYSDDYRGYFPAPYRNEYGNYWSNLLYALYGNGNGLKRTGTYSGGYGAVGSAEYTNYIGYSNQGCRGEKNTIFHCPAQAEGALVNSGGTRRPFPVSYGTSDILSSSAGTKDSTKISAKRINRIAYPSAALLVMDTGSSSGVIIGAYTYYKGEPFPVNIYIHNGGRNFLFSDGHVNWQNNFYPPPWINKLARFWTGTNEN